jgi:hypothetical protein
VLTANFDGAFSLKEVVTSTPATQQAKLDDLIKRLSEIRRALAESETALESQLNRIHPTYLKSARNLAHYIALRHRDIRPLQQELAQLGLSSLGRAEAHVMATLDAVLAAVPGRSLVATIPSRARFSGGQQAAARAYGHAARDQPGQP